MTPIIEFTASESTKIRQKINVMAMSPAAELAQLHNGCVPFVVVFRLGEVLMLIPFSVSNS